MNPRMFTHVVARPPMVVWGFLANLHNDVMWRQEIVAVELVEGEPCMAPSTYRETVRWEGVTAVATVSVTESVPGSRLVVTTEEPRYCSRSVWTFDPHPDGTLVTLVFSLQASGPLKLAERLMHGVIMNWLERDLPRLEGHLAAARPHVHNG